MPTRTFLLFFALLSAAHADDAATSRAAEIEAERDQKSQRLEPDEINRTERLLMRFKDDRILERLSEGIGGVRVKLGGLVQGGGFALGPEYHREGIWAGRADFRAAAQTSFSGYRKLDLQLDVPRLGNDRVFAQFYAVHHNYPGLNYYGPGAGSELTGCSNYRLEDTAIDAAIGVRAYKKFSVGVSSGYLMNNVGPGTDSRFVSSERIYNVAGIADQSNFVRYGVFAQLDYRDTPGGARSGGNYFIQFNNFSDRTLGRHDFQRLDAEMQQFIPFTNKRRVIALRAKTALTFTDGGQSVPFYMQPMLGGADDLRGFRPFRFRDNNLLVTNAEYRWEVFSGMDMAIFADAGKVFAHKSELNFRDLETDIGFGLRFNARNNVFMRVDVAFSHEGFRVNVRFNKMFLKGLLHTSSSQGDL